jgi:hypothetical protein
VYFVLGIVALDRIILRRVALTAFHSTIVSHSSVTTPEM